MRRHDFDIGEQPSSHVLVPWHPPEVMTVAAAAKVMCQTPANVRKLCGRFDLGRRVAGPWYVSRIAMLMFMEGDRKALRLYHGGDRTSPEVVAYYRRCGIAPPAVDHGC